MHSACIINYAKTSIEIWLAGQNIGVAALGAQQHSSVCSGCRVDATFIHPPNKWESSKAALLLSLSVLQVLGNLKLLCRSELNSSPARKNTVHLEAPEESCPTLPNSPALCVLNTVS